MVALDISMNSSIHQFSRRNLLACILILDSYFGWAVDRLTDRDKYAPHSCVIWRFEKSFKHHNKSIRSILVWIKCMPSWTRVFAQLKLYKTTISMHTYVSRSLGQTERSATFLVEFFVLLSLAPTMHANERKSNNDDNNTMAWRKNSADLMIHLMTYFPAQHFFSRTLNIIFKWKNEILQNRYWTFQMNFIFPKGRRGWKWNHYWSRLN